MANILFYILQIELKSHVFHDLPDSTRIIYSYLRSLLNSPVQKYCGLFILMYSEQKAEMSSGITQKSLIRMPLTSRGRPVAASDLLRNSEGQNANGLILGEITCKMQTAARR